MRSPRRRHHSIRRKAEPAKWSHTLNSIFWETLLLAVLGGLEGLVWAAALGEKLDRWTFWGAVVGAGLGALIGLIVGRLSSRVSRCSVAFVMGTLVLPVWLLAVLIGVIVMTIRLL